MSGWTTPTSPTPIVGWEAPSEPQGLGIRESIGAGWRIFRANLGTLVATAALPEILRNLMVIPSILIVVRAWDAMLSIFGPGVDVSQYFDDQVALQRRMEEAFRPPTDLAILSGVASGASIAIALISLSLVTAATLAAVDGRRPSVGGAYRDVAAHAGALIVPAVILGIAWALIGTPLTLGQGSTGFGDASLRTQAALSAVLGLVGFILTVATVVLTVRWSLAIPAILAEGLTLRRGLSRSADLTSGIRVRIFAIFFVLAIVVGFLFSAIGFLAALIVGIATLSLAGGVAAYVVVATIAGLFWLPLAAAVLSHIYRLRAGPIAAANPAAADPVAPGELPADPVPSA